MQKACNKNRAFLQLKETNKATNQNAKHAKINDLPFLVPSPAPTTKKLPLSIGYTKKQLKSDLNLKNYTFFTF